MCKNVHEFSSSIVMTKWSMDENRGSALKYYLWLILAKIF